MNIDRIYTELDALRRTKDPNPKGVDTSAISDLYAFAAYILNDDIANTTLYKAMGTKELCGIFCSAFRKYAHRVDELSTLCASLSVAAELYIFNSDENRTAYDNYLIYHSEELTRLFAILKRLPKESLLTPSIESFCVRIINGYFSKIEISLAIYCKEANLIEIPKYLSDYIGEGNSISSKNLT